MKKRACVLMTFLAASLALSACSSSASDSTQGNTSTETKGETAGDGETEEKETEANEKEKDGTVSLTIEESIANQMRFSSVSNKGYYSFYAEGTTLYAAPNVANDGFWRYAKLAAEGTAGSEIRQIQLAHYPETELILDSEGKLWYGGESFFDRYNIRYFDSFYVTNAGYEQLVAGVTEEGTVVYRSAMSMDGKPEEIEGLENVKYVDVFWDDIAAVREDGTVVFISGDDRIELEDWSDIAMVYVDGSRDDYTEIIGLKKDGTITAKALVGEPSYPEEILSWTDIVHVIRGNDYVAGLKSDGSFVYALEEDASEYSINHCKETFEVWTNVIAAGEDAAITADREALGDARLLSFGWNLKNPPTDLTEALLGEYNGDYHCNIVYELPEIP